MRLIVNNILSLQDKEAIQDGIDQKVNPQLIDLGNLKELRIRLDEYGIHFFECLAWLVANEKLQIVVIRPKGGNGIAHYKNGVLYDGTDYVGFSASCNFTAFGLLENLERLEAFLGWENSRSTKFIDGIKKEFEETFQGKAVHVEYLDVHEVETVIKHQFGGKKLSELMVQEEALIRKKTEFNNNKKIKKLLANATHELEEFESRQRFPYSEGPRAYQKDAYAKWCTNEFHGIFAMATGTGKTITSLNCLLQESLKNHTQVYHALILVPTITLVNQWEEEARKFNFQKIIKVSSKNEWESELSTTLSTAKRIDKSFIVITTYATFIKDRFFKYMHAFPGDTILIADEAHNIGASSVGARLPKVSFQKRIGLSATPKRVYDLEGSEAMEAFFHDKEPYVYNFSMERAIEEGILCKYYYYPHIVKLTSEEFKEYAEITKVLSKFFNRQSDNFDASEIVQRLLLKRKRIIHKAQNKLEATLQILRDRFKSNGNLRYSFIYVPEGNTTEEIDDDPDEAEEIKIINQYTREIGKIDPRILVNQFVSGMADRNEVLEQFKEGKIQVLASMKCLDEGVDIPRAEFAIFCSSTGNPRQFIQRRGRILRKHKDKNIAIVHDLVVIPDLSTSSSASDSFKVERNLVEKELERVMYFASLSINPFHTEEVFEEVCSHYGLNIYTIHDKLKSA